MQRPIDLLSYPCHWGARDTGCVDGPLVLQHEHLEQCINNQGWVSRWLPLIHSQLTTQKVTMGHSAQRAAIVGDLVAQLSIQLKQSLQAEHFPLLLGGDHTIALATWPTVQQYTAQPMGLIWIDAHMDAHTPQTSPTGNLHGMPVATLLQQETILPQHIALIGVRAFEKKEQELLSDLGVRVAYMQEIEHRGLPTVFHEIMQQLLSQVEKFGISLDIDVFSPEIAPGTGYREPHGLLLEPVCEVLQGIIYHPQLAALEMAEFDPHRDVDNKTVNLIKTLVKQLFQKRK